MATGPVSSFLLPVLPVLLLLKQFFAQAVSDHQPPNSTTSAATTTSAQASAVQIIIIIISALFVVGIITCILSHHTMGARSWSDQRNRLPQPHTARMQLQSPCPQQQPPQQQPYTYTLTATSTSIMYSNAAVQERQRLEAGAFHDRLIQLQSVQTDLVMDLPHSIALPDGEELQHCSATKQLKTQETQHHGEITRSFIRPPPNRTVYEVDSLPPFRSNSVGLLQKPASALLAQTTLDSNVPHLVMRSHSMSSNSGSSSTRPGHLLPQKGCLSGTNFVPTQLWIPQQVISHHCPTTNSSDLSGASSNSNRTYTSSKTFLMDSKYTGVDLPPPYDNVANNQWDKNTVDKQNNGV